MARDGELAEPRLPAPSGLRTVLGFSRLSAAAYAIIRRAIDEDPAFRARVAAAADAREVGRAGWLWLQRPEGWDADPALAGSADDHQSGRGQARLRRERDGAEAAAARWKQVADDAEAARARAEAQLADAVQAGRAEAEAEHGAARAELARLGEERNAAVRAQKRLEAELASAGRDLKAARAALVAAEADLAAARRPRPSTAPAADAATDGPAAALPEATSVEPSGAGPDPIDRRAAHVAVDAASRAASDLASALAGVAEALASPVRPAEERGLDAAWPPADARPVAARRAKGRRAAGPGPAGAARRPERVRPALPPGVFDDSADAHRHLVSSGEAALVVDGYNLARAAWSGLSPEEERRRAIALLEEVQARSGGDVTVVFDGQDDTVAPPASRSVRVLFSASGVTADEAIADLLGARPVHQPVVVVSSDREVAGDARRQGAVVLSSTAFLAAAGR